MKHINQPRGVLGADYADTRRSTPHLAFRYKVRARIMADAISSHLKKDGDLHLLDLGSAEASGLLELARLLPSGSFTGVELSEPLISQAPTALPQNIRLIRGDVTSLPASMTRTPGFDAVTAGAILEHLASPLEAVRQAGQALRPGGLFVATCPDPRWDRLSNILGLERHDHHEVDMARSILTGLVKAAGLQLVSYYRFMWAPIAILPYLRIPVSPHLSITLDQIIRSVHIFDWLFVNQCVIARKP